jgi:hypothetical protein
LRAMALLARFLGLDSEVASFHLRNTLTG